MRRARLLALVGTLVGCGTGLPAPSPSPVPPAEAPPADPDAASSAAESAAAPPPADEPLQEPIANRKRDPRAPEAPAPPTAEVVPPSPTEPTDGLGLSGVGRGGGGKGAGIGLGTTGTIGRGAGRGFGSGHGRLGAHRVRPPRVRGGSVTVGGATTSRGPRRPRPPATPRPPARASVAAGEWNDNANYREYLAYLETQKKLRFERVDLQHRRFIVVHDDRGRPVPNCRVSLRDGAGHQATLTTTASGRAILFPHAEGLSLRGLEARTTCGGAAVSTPVPASGADGVAALRLPRARDLGAHEVVDVVFVLDTTGSMSEEIGALRATLAEVSESLEAAGVHLRVGLVEYRDRGEAFTTRRHPMTTNAKGLAERIRTLRASGGGDAPEDVNEGLRVAIEDMRWSPSSVARLAFLIGDAPPQLDYRDGPSYLASARRAATEGIKIFTIAASGQDDLGQVVWRQIAHYTGATNMFVLRGGAGPQSTGGGDPTSSCGGTQQQYSTGNLAALIRGKVQRELAALNGDPMRIAGLHRDEHAKPCDQRIATQ